MTLKKILITGFLFGFLFLLSPQPIRAAADLTAGALGGAVGAAGIPVADVGQSFWRTVTGFIQKAGSFAFQKTLSSTLNKIAYDAAMYVGSGGEGQGPLFTRMTVGDYLAQIGDEAAGEFIETFVNDNFSNNNRENCSENFNVCSNGCNGDATCLAECAKAATDCNAKASKVGAYTPSINVCSPSSLGVKLRIGLGLVEQQRPGPPNCTVTKMIENWETDINQKLEDLRDPNFLSNFGSYFDPRANDLGIAVSAYIGMNTVMEQKAKAAETNYTTNKGWLDVRNIAGELEGTPGNTEKKINDASDIKKEALGKTTGDILVDAANIFLNQLAFTAFQNLLSNLGDKADRAVGAGRGIKVENDPSAIYGEMALNEIVRNALQPQFNTIADYNILAQLAICSDKNNPGPDNCVIDGQFVQAISEQKTVIEAVNAGYLYPSWQITNDVAGDSYNSNYSLRNISILRKYRILPVGWEEAALFIGGLKGQAPKKATLMDLISCFDPNDSYNQFSTDFSISDQGWCEGLVDPNWLLKAPLNYCKRAGIGPSIISKEVISGSGTGLNKIPSSLSIIRSDGYCADSQSCIKENKDGSCETYGYCNEEKRTWKFNADACEPIYNTCQSFVSESGQAASYLQNTLDYGECDSGNSGCRRYALSGNYATSSGQVTWNGEDDLYLNKNLGSCDSKDEGCTELLRVKPTWGSNLIMNADFAADEVGASSTNSTKLNDWSLTTHIEKAEIVRAELDPGIDSGKAIKLTIESQQTGGINSINSFSLLPDNFQILTDQSYTLSAEVYAASGTPVSLAIGDVNWGFVATSTGSNSWQQLSITRPANTSYNEADFKILAEARGGSSATLYVKNIKFEIGNWSTSFNLYGSYRIYQKLIPNYLEKVCYEDVSSATKNYTLKENAPAACYKFTRQCNKNEVGCELFTSKVDNFSVAAQAASEDYCAAECVGYDAYVARASHFSLASEERMIPAKAKTCSANAAGCTEFTNLDKVGQGGEGREYYSELKHCIKPSQAQATCRDFYTWEGQGAGYQLKAYSLEADSNSPRVLSGGSACNAAIYNSPVNSPQYNSDCQEFYNTSGGVFYALLSKTVTCSESCNTYRMNNKNIDKTKTTQAQCTGDSSGWDNDNGVCYVCLNEGKWDSINKTCLYQAIPGEGRTCSAGDNGCREYNGNYGNNVRLLSYYDFENGLSDWTSNCANVIATSTVSNNKNGHSLKYNSGVSCGGSITRAPRRIIEEIIAGSNQEAQLDVSGQVTYGKAYTVKFMAKANIDTTLNLKFLNSAGQETSLTPVIVRAGAWNLYQANLDNLNHDVSGEEKLIITADQDFFLDNFTLSEITDRYYLIKNSSQVPDICYYDIFDKYRGFDYNLGCSAYTDRAGLTHNLHRFSNLCSESAVGCEQMINTANSSSYQKSISNDVNKNGACDSNEVDCALVPRDRALYVVYDATKLCAADNKGCSRLGEGQGGAALLGWSDVFKKNDPDQYERTMCDLSSLGCEAWKNSGDGGFSYFKNPGFKTCTYRASQNSTISGKNWYKIPSKRCDLNNDNKISGAESSGPVCLNDNMCGGKKCIIDNNDYLCSVSYLKTIGLGGAGNQIPTPDQEAALCEASASGCTEYIDMVSRFSPNVVKNPSYKAGQNTPNIFPGWSTGPNPEQVVALKPHKLYSLYVEGTSVSARLDNFNNANSSILPWYSDNSFGTTTSAASINSAQTQPLIFNSLGNNKATLTGGAIGRTIELKELIVDYRLKSQVDKKSCNGLVNFDNGCVLFNERSVVGASGLASLVGRWDAYASSAGVAPKSCSGSGTPYSCTANTLIKVRPDRTCNKWLDCVTYIQDPETKQKTCYAYGECDRLSDKNECANFLEIATGTQEFIAQNNKNTSGFAVLGKYSLANDKEVGSSVNNGNFDFEGASALTCQATQQSNVSVSCPNDLIINEPSGAPTDYPAHGQAYLKVPGEYRVSPNGEAQIAVIKDTNYFINYLVSTRGASHKARIEIIGDRGFLTSTTTQANNGWERKIFKFNSGSNTKIKVYLSANIQVNSGALATPIYFDDINIEPVLEIGENQYAARECRLYPTANSLSCFNKNENVFTSGLEGYCLERDYTNPANCLLWHPLDKLASSRSSRSTLGYQGQFPLNYCTEVDANFDLVEKREVFYQGGTDYGVSCGTSPVPAQGIAFTESCQGDNNYYTFTSYTNVSVNNSNHCAVSSWCIPKRLRSTTTDWIDANVSHGNSGWVLNSGFKASTSTGDKIILETLSKTEKIVKKDSDDFFKGYEFDCSDGVCMQIALFRFLNDSSEGWYKYNGLDSNAKENTNADPAIRVFDYNNPVLDEKYLSLVSAKNEVDEKNVYRLKCNEFTEVVDASGNNYSWSGRIKSTQFGTSTPPFFKYDYPALDSYSRNRDSIPFGSAFWSDNFNLSISPKVPLVNQYSISNGENIEEVYAGRPYGCNGSSCDIIGYCSNNPNVYCLVGSDNISRLTCNISKVDGGTNQGECLPLMKTASGTPVLKLPVASDTQKILRNIFLSGERYEFNATSSGYKYNGNWNYTTPIGKCASSGRPFSDQSVSFCAIYPEISNIKMYSGSSNTETDKVLPNMLYRLEFNTEVDVEQQPLREIIIKWGDGSVQVIPDQDHRPQNTHVFYHLYVQPMSSSTVNIKITDNWGFYKEGSWSQSN